jgi:tetratricopeptide (TPR) repeat protein
LKNLSSKILSALIFLIAVAFSTKSFREPDLWWQIRTGEWILENHEVPKQDIFSYTFAGKEWINIKWLSEVLFAITVKLVGPESVFILQMMVSCLIIFFLMRLTLIFAGRFKFSDASVWAIMPLGFVALMCGIEYRVIGRPEMFSHLFTVVFIYLHEKNRGNFSKWLYAIIPLQLLWANMHEAFATGLIITAIYTAAAWVEYFLTRKKLIIAPVQRPIRVTLIALTSLLSIIINPNGWKLFKSPLSIFSQIFENKYTTELLNYSSGLFWTKEAYIAIAFFILVIALVVMLAKLRPPKESWTNVIIRQLGMGYLILVVAFVYLASTAQRNIIFVNLAAFPVAVISLGFFANRIAIAANFIDKNFEVIKWGMCGLLVLFYIFVVSNKYYEVTDSHDRFGLEVLSVNNPCDAAEFVSKSRITGKCFSDYLTSSYLLWKLQPQFETYIDLRDLDVFTPEFFSKFAEVVSFPDEFEQLDSTEKFDYIVLYRPQFSAVHSYLYHDSRFKLAHADAVACVYVPKEKTEIAAAEFSNCTPQPISAFANVVNHILNPLYKKFDYADTDFEPQAASFYQNIGELELAEKHALLSLQKNIEPHLAYTILGDIYFKKGTNTANDMTLDTAAWYYQQAILANNHFAQGYYGYGNVLFARKQYVAALEQFEKSATLDKQLLNAHLLIAECCKALMNRGGEYLDKALQHYEQANLLNPDNPKIIFNLGALYFQAGNCKKSVQYFEKIKEFKGLTPDESRAVQDYLLKCGNQ